MALNCGHSQANRGVTPVSVGRKFQIIIPAGSPVWISISPSATGDATTGDVHYAKMLGGASQTFFIPAGAPPQFLSGVTEDPNGDLTPAAVTFIDSGASGI